MLLPAVVFTLAQQCSPDVDPNTMAALVASESSGNPYAIGVVDMRLDKQPANLEEAIDTAKMLIAKGANISVGLGQINHKNFDAYGLTIESAFDACTNLGVSSKILSSCYTRASTQQGEGQDALKAAFSCYYSNNFTRGFVTEGNNQPSYVKKIAVNNAKLKNVPEIQFTPNDIKEVPQKQKEADQAGKDVKALEDVSNTSGIDSKDAETKRVSWDVLNDFDN